jgi:insulysin
MASDVPNRPSPVQVLSSNIEKGELDDRSYRLIKLVDNKLEVLLVHDPTTEKSSAAMDVHVGSLSDPKDFPGLAHALEHFLFLGNVTLQAKLISSRYKEVSRGK